MRCSKCLDTSQPPIHMVVIDVYGGISCGRPHAGEAVFLRRHSSCKVLWEQRMWQIKYNDLFGQSLFLTSEWLVRSDATMYVLSGCGSKVWPLNFSSFKTRWQHLWNCWLMPPQVSMPVTAAQISVCEFKVKAETSPGQEPALVICIVTSYSAIKIYWET